MSSPDQPTTPSPTGLPTPPDGAGAAELATDSNDPQELRDLLDRARERLAFYESFDRIIGENIRRSGELMLETVALREQAQALATQSGKERAEFESIREADRERYRAVVADALAEVQSARPVIDGMVAKLQDALETLEGATPGDATPASAASVATTSALVEPWQTGPVAEEPAPSPDEAAMQADSADVAEAPAAETTEPTTTEDAPVPADATMEASESGEPVARNITVLAHGVPNAKIAIALQKMLRGLDAVTNVEAREFANGELRLAVTANDVLPEAELASWLADHHGEISSTTPSVSELTFEG